MFNNNTYYILVLDTTTNKTCLNTYSCYLSNQQSQNVTKRISLKCDKENNPVKKSLLLSFYFFSINTLTKESSNIFGVITFCANLEQVTLQD